MRRRYGRFVGRFVGRTSRCACMAAIMASCVFNYGMTPYFECMLDGDCDSSDISSMTWVFARSVSLACFVSYAVVWAKYRGGVAEYDARIALHDVYSPTTDADRGRYATFNAAVVATCALLILPVNGVRMFKFLEDRRPAEVLVYFGLMYTQNALMCLLETHFVLLCYVLYTKFVRINRDMVTIGDEIDAATADRGRPASLSSPSREARHTWTVNDSDLYCSRATGQLLVDAVERLKIRHRLIREAMDELQHVFAVPVGMSLCNLCVMAMFDIYYQLMNVYVQQTSTRSNVYICLWLAQYMFRFFIVVITVHATTNQALKSKNAIMHVNRNCLDVYTKEELQVFSNQISSTTMEFTICDLFTLNTHLFTSAMGATTTYLVILLQMKTKADNIY